MNGEILFELIGDAAAGFIDETAPRKKRVSPLRFALPAAACVALALLCAVILGGKGRKDEERAAENAPIPPEETELPDETILESLFGEGEACWIPFFIHDGAAYVHQITLRADADCVGEYVGRSRSTADFKKKLSDYTELTGSFSGSVFTVRGVDPSIMLCTRTDHGQVELFVSQTDSTDYKLGRDILEDRLHLSEQLTGAVLCPAEPVGRAFYSAGEEQAAAVDALIELLNEGEVFIQSREPVFRLPARLYFTTDSGLVIGFYVCDGFVTLISHCTYGFNSICIRADGEKLAEFVRLMEEEGSPAADPLGGETTLDDCRLDERFGAFIPGAVPPGYKLLYAAIRRELGENGRTVLGTSGIEFELFNGDGHYIRVEIGPGAADAFSQPTLEAVQAARRRSPESFTVAVLRGGVKIAVTGCFGASAEAVYSVAASIGE